MAAFTLEETQRLESLRRKEIDGTATREELKEALFIMRQSRTGASVGTTAGRAAKAAAKAPVDTASVLDKLKALGKDLKSQTFEG